VRSGFVESFNRPGKNVTGIITLSTDLETKKLELLHEIVPRPALIAVLLDPKFSEAEAQLKEFSSRPFRLVEECYRLAEEARRMVEECYRLGSLRLDVSDLHYFGPLLVFGCNIIAELGGGENHWNRTDLGKPFLDGRLASPALISPASRVMISVTQSGLRGLFGHRMCQHLRPVCRGVTAGADAGRSGGWRRAATAAVRSI
jgi:hypothetical protein